MIFSAQKKWQIKGQKDEQDKANKFANLAFGAKMSKTLVIVALILIILGLWFLPALTKTTITGAFSYLKGQAANIGLIK